jgi:hypothetical protein
MLYRIGIRCEPVKPRKSIVAVLSRQDFAVGRPTAWHPTQRIVEDFRCFAAGAQMLSTSSKLKLIYCLRSEVNSEIFL